MSQETLYYAGLDVGSTTLKLVVLDNDGKTLFTDYRRHNADIAGELHNALIKAREEKLGDAPISLAVTGSAGMGLSETYGLPFIQEVVAAAEVATRLFPDIRTLVDIGGEDAKMIFFSPDNAPDIRMNGSCAGGTGAFIDQVATLLGCDVSELNSLAEKAQTIHPIASRCGVFAKTDIQNLLSRNVPPSDIAASVFHAVALQLVTTLARGREITPKMLFCGGPLAFIPELRKACLQVMQIAEEDCALPENAALVPALGCALARERDHLSHTINEFLEIFSHHREKVVVSNSAALPALFTSEEEHRQWKVEKEQYKLPRKALVDFDGEECYLGIDSGSTTTKIVVVDPEENVLFTHYAKNAGNPLETVANGLDLFKQEALAAGKGHIKLVSSAVTGYGEDLVKAAFNFQEGLVETIAHYLAAHKLDPDVSFILDIGGQDMKAIFIDHGVIVRLDINEACSSGCGSFIEGFANSLKHTAAEFSSIACTSASPCDLGTRCTVFMNSKVKQSLREGSTLPDIASGLAYSVIKNCLYKVLKLKDPSVLGDHIVVQGGTMRNHAVVRSLEILTDKSVLFADMPELMGAYGAALHACRGGVNTQDILSPDVEVHKSSERKTCIPLSELTHPAKAGNEETTCKGCENRCKVHKFIFDNENTYFSGNKCEKIFTNRGADFKKGANIYLSKFSGLFSRATSTGTDKPVLTIGIPRALNYYENYPFWHALLRNCGIKAVLSSKSTFPLYEKGAGTVMSDNICFPAKLVHGHVYDLIGRGVDRILMPFVVYEKQEDKKSDNTFNCPVVTGYSDVIKSAINPEGKHGIPLDAPAVNFRDEELLKKSCREYMVKQLGIPSSSFEQAFKAALQAQTDHESTLNEKAKTIAESALKEGKTLIMLAGRPYHTDPLIQHKVSDLIAGFGVDVISEDVVRDKEDNTPNTGTIRQWAYTNRILKAAQWVADAPENVHFVQLTSFGCGPDAFILDEAGEILRRAGKSHTVIKIDDINNLGSVRLRIRSLVESLAFRSGSGEDNLEEAELSNRAKAKDDTPLTTPVFRVEDKKRTILAPFFSEFYSPFIPAILGLMGYNVVTLPPSDSSSIDYGLKYANNEVCYPATLVVGDIVRALKSGEYNPDEVAIAITQTGGQCRASNYLALIKKALIASGFPNVPVISAVTPGGDLENSQPGFELSWQGNLRPVIAAVLYSDKISQMFYSTVPREKIAGKSVELRDHYIDAGVKAVSNRDIKGIYKLLDEAAGKFNELADDSKDVPRIGLVGEIYVKYNSIGHKNIVNWLISQGVEVVVPPLVNFFLQEFPNRRANRKMHLERFGFFDPWIETLAFSLVDYYLKKFDKAASRFKFHHPFSNIYHEAKSASRISNLASQYGEGWLISAELCAFAERGINNAVSVQPFGCIANHLVAKGIEKKIRDLYPSMSLLFLDLDSGASEANMLNRLHFLMQNARTKKPSLTH